MRRGAQVMLQKAFLVGLVVTTLVLVSSFVLWAQELELVKLDECLEWFKQDPGEPQFKPGDVLTYKDIEKLKPWIPREFWSVIFTKDMKITIAETRDYSPHPLYLEATKKFGTQARIGPKGELLDYVAGYPFPSDSIKVGDPQAGYKLVWNWEYRWQNEGLGADHWEGWLRSPGGTIDRKVGGLYKRTYFTHRADLPENNYTVEAPDAKDFQRKEWVQITMPFDVKDTTFVSFRYADSFKEDDGWAYVPALRRVRRMSMATRADSFMGTEYTIDDFYNFSGRPADWEWKLINRRKMLTSIAIDKKTITDNDLYGHHKLIPITRWELRDTFIVDNIPKWERHPYARKLFYVDVQTMYSTWTSAWDKKNELWKGFILGWYWSEDGFNPQNKGLRLPVWASLTCIDYQNNKGTIAMPGPDSKWTASVYQGIPGETTEKMSGPGTVKYFDINRLTRGR